LPRRERDVVERELRAFDPLLRLLAFLAPAVLFAARLPLDFAAEDFERDEDELFFAAPAVRDLPLLRDPLLRVPLELLPVEVPASIDHLPLITRCAASATASAISDPNLVALDSTDFAALSAVSAASIPASRIAFRALGLALIAAAAAASPAASISLLMAALASFSVVDFEGLADVLPVLEDLDPLPEDRDRAFDDLDPVLLLDLAIVQNLPLLSVIDTRRK
jgi:hypothetical protein